MKLFLVVLCGVAALSARAAAEEPILQYYHDSAGVALAELIRQSEEAADFDGSRIAGGSLANLGAYPYLVNALPSQYPLATPPTNIHMLTDIIIHILRDMFWFLINMFNNPITNIW